MSLEEINKKFNEALTAKIKGLQESVKQYRDIATMAQFVRPKISQEANARADEIEASIEMLKGLEND